MIRTAIAQLMPIAVIILSSLEGWYAFWQAATVIAIGLTFVTGVGTFLTGKWLNERQGEENKKQATGLVQLETDLEKQREKTALAEKATLELERLIKQPRMVDRIKGDNILDWGEKGLLRVGYPANNEEAMLLAEDMRRLLEAHGWKVLSTTPSLSPGIRVGITIFVNRKGWDMPKEPPDGLPEPIKTLYRFLSESVPANPSTEVIALDDMPEGDISVMIGSKY